MKLLGALQWGQSLSRLRILAKTAFCMQSIHSMALQPSSEQFRTKASFAVSYTLSQMEQERSVFEENNGMAARNWEQTWLLRFGALERETADI